MASKVNVKFVGLLVGTLVVVPSAVTRSPEDFLDLLIRHRVTMLNQTPTAFRGLVALAGAGDPRIDELAVRAVVFAGEKLEFADLVPWVARRDLAAQNFDDRPFLRLEQANLHIETDPPLSLLITEVQTLNVQTVADPGGNHVPWVEIYNTGTVDAPLRDCYLSDDANALAKWRFPDDLIVGAGDSVVIWCDAHPERSQPPGNSHTSFSLSPQGGLVVLSRVRQTEPQLLHQIGYPALASDEAFGLGSTADPWSPSILSSASPGFNNPAGTSGEVRINEWMAANQSTLREPISGRFEDWIELYNSGSKAVQLDGWSLTDEADLSNPWPFPSGIKIEPKGFLIVWADGQTLTGGVHASFKLSAQGETLTLLGANHEIVDRVAFGGQLPDTSQGRSPDGGATLATLTSSTPGSSNRSPANRPPVLSSPPQRLVYPGEAVAFSVVGADPDVPVQSVLLSLEPPFETAAFDPNSGAFLWTPSLEDTGRHVEFKFKARDSGQPSLSTTQSFLVSVAAPLASGIIYTNRPIVSFLALSNRAYSIDWRESLDYGRWIKLTNVAARITNRLERVGDANPAADGRLYRLVTPPSPDRTPGPLVLRSPRSLNVRSGTRAELSVFAVGNGPLRYQWFQNDQPIPGATRSNLIWESIGPEAVGNYTVIVSNPTGTATNEPPAEILIEQ